MPWCIPGSLIPPFPSPTWRITNAARSYSLRLLCETSLVPNPWERSCQIGNKSATAFSPSWMKPPTPGASKWNESKCKFPHSVFLCGKFGSNIWYSSYARRVSNDPRWVPSIDFCSPRYHELPICQLKQVVLYLTLLITSEHLTG